MKCLAIAVLVTLMSFTHSQQRICDEFIDVMLVVDGSTSVFPSRNEYTEGLKKLINLLDINGATETSKVQVGICIFGDISVTLVDLSLGNTVASVTSVITEGAFPGGSTAVNKGLECAFNQTRESARTGANTVIVTILDGEPSTDAQKTETEKIITDLKAAGDIISVIAIGNHFADVDGLMPLATDPSLFIKVDSFADFQLRTEDFFDRICPEMFIPTTTAAPTTPPPPPPTTTTPAPPPSNPCDSCIVMNGIGYAKDVDSCWHYWVCNMKTDGSWEPIRRPTAVGTFWNQNMISQGAAQDVVCDVDPCSGKVDGFQMEAYENCRALITCFGGRVAVAECCPLGMEATALGCVNDMDGSCTRLCPEPVEVVDRPCINFAIPGFPTLYLVIDGITTVVMSCPAGTVFRQNMCGCDHGGPPVQPMDCTSNPEIDLQFLPGDAVVDISRNGYTISTENFHTGLSGLTGSMTGLFDGTTRVRINNANSDLTQAATIKIVFASYGPQTNAALVTNAECANSVATLSVVAETDGVSGKVRTGPNNSLYTVSATGASGPITTVVMHYDGKDTSISIDGGTPQTIETGRMMYVGQTCDGIKLGLGKDMNGFTGEIMEFKMWKCMAEP